MLSLLSGEKTFSQRRLLLHGADEGCFSRWKAGFSSSRHKSVGDNKLLLWSPLNLGLCSHPIAAGVGSDGGAEPLRSPCFLGGYGGGFRRTHLNDWMDLLCPLNAQLRSCGSEEGTDSVVADPRLTWVKDGVCAIGVEASVYCFGPIPLNWQSGGSVEGEARWDIQPSSRGDELDPFLRRSEMLVAFMVFMDCGDVLAVKTGVTGIAVDGDRRDGGVKAASASWRWFRRAALSGLFVAVEASGPARVSKVGCVSHDYWAFAIMWAWLDWVFMAQDLKTAPVVLVKSEEGPATSSIILV